MKLNTILLAVSLALGLHAAENDLGERVLFDALAIPSAEWQLAEGVTSQVIDGVLMIRNAGSFCWATPGAQLPYDPDASVVLTVDSVGGGTVSVQAEWFKADGGFISATPVLERAKSGAAVEGRKLSEFAPKDAKPAKFRLKFWVEGKGAIVRFSRASIRAHRAWHNPKTETLAAFSGTAEISEEGLKVEKRKDALEVTLPEGKAYASFLFKSKVRRDPGGVVMLDLARVQGGALSVQAVCFDMKDGFIKSVDLLKGANEPGLYEIPLSAYADQFNGVSRIMFKVWMEGAKASASLGGLFYGVAP
jgi:hypothetical protein